MNTFSPKNTESIKARVNNTGFQVVEMDTSSLILKGFGSKLVWKRKSVWNLLGISGSLLQLLGLFRMKHKIFSQNFSLFCNMQNWPTQD